MGASAPTCGSHEHCPKQRKRQRSGYPVVVAGLGECHSCCGGRLGLDRLGDRGLGCRGRGFQRGIFRGPRGGLSGSGVSIDGRLIHAIARRNDPIGLLRRRRGHIGLNHHVRCHDPCSIHHATSTKDSVSRRHKPCGHKRPARARNAAVGTGRIKPRSVDGKPTAAL